MGLHVAPTTVPTRPNAAPVQVNTGLMADSGKYREKQLPAKRRTARPGVRDGRSGRGDQGSRPCLPPSSPPSSTSEYSRSFVSLCRPSITRTVPDFDRITIDWVLHRFAR